MGRGGAATDLEAAGAVVLSHARPLTTEQVRLAEAFGRVLAGAVVSTQPVPGFDNSAMDGFAVRAADTAGARDSAPVSLRVVGESRAGHPAGCGVGPAEAVAVSTGAVLPAGADAVVRAERVAVHGGAAAAGLGTVEVVGPVAPGSDIRRAGEDIPLGAAVLRGGSTVGVAELAVLAAIGCDHVPCVRRPRIRLLTTGDELLSPGEEPRLGGIRDSSAVTLAALARAAGAAVIGCAQVDDSPAATRAAIAAALDPGADVVVICGGVSVGSHDHVRQALAVLGVEQRFWRVAIRPGKPVWFGTMTTAGSDRTTLVFGLPGNPVAAMITFMLLVRPALRMLGGESPDADRVSAEIAVDYVASASATDATAVGCALDRVVAPHGSGWRVRELRPPSAHRLGAMLGVDGIAILAPRAAPRATMVEVELFPGRAG